MKMNWGVGITVLYIGFVAMILGLVGMSMSQNIDLVTEHYYEEELEFQNKIEKKQRSAALPNPLTWQVNEGGIAIIYPDGITEKRLSGEIKLYCPSNKKNDRSFSVLAKNNRQVIPIVNIPEGNYHLQIDWKNSDQTYWSEDVIVIHHTKQ